MTGLKPTMLYLIGQRNGDVTLPYCKVGIATDIKSRLSGINTGTPFDCFVYRQYPFKKRDTAVAVENAILVHLADRNVRGEWVSGTPQEVLPLIEHLLVDKMPVGYVQAKRKRTKILDIAPAETQPEPPQKQRVRTPSEWVPYAPHEMKPRPRPKPKSKLKPETIAMIRHLAESSRQLLR